MGRAQGTPDCQLHLHLQWPPPGSQVSPWEVRAPRSQLPSSSPAQAWELQHEFCLAVNIIFFFPFAFSSPEPPSHLSKHFISHKYNRISVDQSG